MTLLAFAADSRAAAAPLLLGARHPPLSMGRPAANPTHAAKLLTDGTDRRTDTVPLHRSYRILREQCQNTVKKILVVPVTQFGKKYKIIRTFNK